MYPIAMSCDPIDPQQRVPQRWVGLLLEHSVGVQGQQLVCSSAEGDGGGTSSKRAVEG
jgi:hypothetical protein